MSGEVKLTFVERLRLMRATRFGAFVPVLFALAAIWTYFGVAAPLMEHWSDPTSDGVRFIFLSPRNIYNLFTALLGVLMLAGVPSPLACLMVMVVGIVMGAAQGMLIAYVGIPSFVVTLAGLLGYQGLMQKILPTGNLNIGDPFVRGIARVLLPDMLGLVLAGALVITTMNAYRSVPLLIVLLVSVTAIVGWVTTSTPFGRSIFAVGGNAESARRVGMDVKRIRVAAFGIVGLLAAIGGIFGASRYGSVSYTSFAGGSLLLESIGAAVIGGTSLFGGRGSVWNAILGALVIGSLGNGLDLSGASAADKLMFSGAILLLAVAVDAISRSAHGDG